MTAGFYVPPSDPSPVWFDAWPETTDLGFDLTPLRHLMDRWIQWGPQLMLCTVSALPAIALGLLMYLAGEPILPPPSVPADSTPRPTPATIALDFSPSAQDTTAAQPAPPPRANDVGNGSTDQNGSQSSNQNADEFETLVSRTLDLFSRPEPEPPRSPEISIAQDPTCVGPGETLFQGGTDSPVAWTVGAAEGTRTTTGERTPAYYGHVDPGNQAWNLGTFSYQHGARSPAEADQTQLARLQRQLRILCQRAAERNIRQDRLTHEVLLNGIDLANQAPLAALSINGGYMHRLEEAYSRGFRGADAVLEARIYSYLNPQTNRWDAPGLGNTYQGIKADQQRRQAAIARVLEHRGIIAHQPLVSPGSHPTLTAQPMPPPSPPSRPTPDVFTAERSSFPPADYDQLGVLSFALL
jgi:hypothetical protein